VFRTYVEQHRFRTASHDGYGFMRLDRGADDLRKIRSPRAGV
jgi:hypothetical protein